MILSTLCCSLGLSGFFPSLLVFLPFVFTCRQRGNSKAQ